MSLMSLLIIYCNLDTNISQSVASTFDIQHAKVALKFQVESRKTLMIPNLKVLMREIKLK